MTLEQLRVFVAVAEALHVTRAAESLHLTQSAASASIATLESRYDVRLFHRVGRGIELTREGARVLPDARALLRHAAAVDLLLGELTGELRGELRIAASQTVVNDWLPARIVAWHACHPLVRVDVQPCNTEQAMRAVLDGAADIAVVEGAIAGDAFEVVEVQGDRLVVVLPPGHRWASRSTIDATRLAGARWVMRERGSGTRNDIEAALAAAGTRIDALDVVIELPSNEAVLAAVEAGAGISAVSVLAASRRRLPMIDPGWPPRRFSVAHHRERTPNRAQQALLALLTED